MQEEPFEKYLQVINAELEKRRGSWRLSQVSWMDYDDVKAEIKIHIMKKWHLWNQEKPLKSWLQTLIQNQIRNKLRNVYYIRARPCLKCEFATGQEECGKYGKQCQKCPIFANWALKKRDGYNMELAISYTNVDKPKISESINGVHCDNINYRQAICLIKVEQKKRLQARQYEFFISYFFEKKIKRLKDEDKRYLEENLAMFVGVVKDIIRDFELVQFENEGFFARNFEE